MRKKTIDTIPVLNDEIFSILNTFSKSRSLPASLVNRSQIVLLSAQECTNQQIASHVGLHYNNVATWRNRFLLELPVLREIQEKAPDKLSGKIKDLLSDKKRPGAPNTYTPEQITKIIDLACKYPKEFDHEASHWSLNLLVKEITKQGIADAVSAKSVSRFLKCGAVTPTQVPLLAPFHREAGGSGNVPRKSK